MPAKSAILDYDYDDFENVLKLNKRQRKAKGRVKQNSKLRIRNIEPRTNAQERAVDSYLHGQNLLLHGMAGTGKTFLSMYLALKDVLGGFEDRHKLVIVRSVVPTRDMGFLPGSVTEKTKVYELPYKAICSELFGRGDAYDILRAKGIIEFISTSYIRGTTLDNCIVLVDECQNMNFHELDSVITRMGENIQLIFSGDFRQSDFVTREKDDLLSFMKIITKMNNFDPIEFYTNDIVRSSMVKEYIIERANQGYM
jgi:phosphate starvation-inducible PhoH-like protein